jgi:hypothetical protein
MKRRALLLTGSLATLAVASSPLVAFTQDRPPEDALLAGISDAYRAAQRAQRPLLVLVIPEDNAARWDRGTAFGALLNHGPDDALVALGLVELACAPASALRQLVPQAPAGEPLMVLVDPSRMPATATVLDAPLRAMPAAYDAPDAEIEGAIDARIATLATLLTRGLGPRATSLSPSARAAARQRAIDTHRAHRIRGSYWATDAGCGVYVEEVPETGGYDCGMGHTPPRARRFLHFFSVARP